MKLGATTKELIETIDGLETSVSDCSAKTALVIEFDSITYAGTAATETVTLVNSPNTTAQLQEVYEYLQNTRYPKKSIIISVPYSANNVGHGMYMQVSEVKYGYMYKLELICRVNEGLGGVNHSGDYGLLSFQIDGSNYSVAATWYKPGYLTTDNFNGLLTSPMFFAPTTGGASGQFLQSNGWGAPTWVNAPSGSAPTLLWSGECPLSSNDGIAVEGITGWRSLIVKIKDNSGYWNDMIYYITCNVIPDDYPNYYGMVSGSYNIIADSDTKIVAISFEINPPEAQTDGYTVNGGRAIMLEINRETGIVGTLDITGTVNLTEIWGVYKL